MNTTIHRLQAGALEADIMDFGGRLLALRAPDRNGVLEEVTLGLEHPDSHRTDRLYLGALVGRYANRIAHGRFILNGHRYQIPVNDRGHALHGGPQGLDRQYWEARQTGASLRLRHVSPDGDCGFPGTLEVDVTYTLKDAALWIEYGAVCDADTVINLTSHPYFNLAGGADPSLLGHQLVIHANRFLPVDAALIPTGELQEVAGTPFDFRRAHTIGSRIHDDDDQLRRAGGYDHTFALSAWDQSLRPAAQLSDARSGRCMEVLTTEPGLHLYTGNSLDGSVMGRSGVPLRAHAGVCLETQHFPDSPNRPGFPSTVLRAGHRYASTTVYRFSCLPPA